LNVYYNTHHPAVLTHLQLPRPPQLQRRVRRNLV